MEPQTNKKRKLSNASLILGVGAIVVPILFSFGNSFLILVLKRPSFPIPWGLYVFRAGYLVLIASGLMASCIGLILKPRAWGRDAAKILLGILCLSFALFYFGRIIFVSAP